MKILFTISSLVTRGGKERVLTNKANHMADKWNAEVIIVTTDQKNNPPVYPLSSKIKHIDLGINYEDYRKPGVIANFFSQAHCVRTHKQKMKNLLRQERPDIVVTLFGREMNWLGKINDGSKKILEYHFARHVLKQSAQKHPLLWWKYWIKMRALNDYDLFAVLTEEDKKAWPPLSNIITMPNALTYYPAETASLDSRRVLAVGRLSPEKGFDRLLNIWSQVAPSFPDWRLSIIGDGPDKDTLVRQAHTLGLFSSVEFLPSTPKIQEEYLKSSIFVMTSRYEGFPMVLLEAMAHGLPAVSYACKCGPAEIILDGKDGFLVLDGDERNFADRLSLLMCDTALRTRMGQAAHNDIARFSEDRIMTRWREIYERLITP